MDTDELKILYDKSIQLILPYLQLEGDNVQKSPFSKEGKESLSEGITGLKKVIDQIESSWASWWFIGKAQQAMGNHEESYESFLTSYRINLTQEDVLRELSLECLMTDRFREAAYYSNVAIEFSPDDPSLWANMAVCQLFNKNNEKAENWANKALGKLPDDKPSLEVLKYVNGIRKGTLTLPKKFSMFE